MDNESKTIVAGEIHPQPKPGEIFRNRYRIIKELGEGAMGKVFQVEDLKVSEVIALKILKTENIQKEDYVKRFIRELKSARKIVHKNVIRIHDLDQVDDILYISMQYIEGKTLKQMSQMGLRLTIKKIIEVLREICEGLEAMHNHEEKIVHRDIKPQNIMMDNNGKTYILDFGIARPICGETVTGPNQRVGTPLYMSPEQINCEKIDEITDIYQLGIILYELVTHRHPFEGKKGEELYRHHLFVEPEPPSKYNSEVPEYLESIILKCMAKKPGERYASVREILMALDNQKETIDEIPGANNIGTPPGEVESNSTGPKVKSPAMPKKYKRYGLFLLGALLSIYLIISVISLIFDAVYAGKLESFYKEYNDHFETLFPISKDNYLPNDWKTKDQNAWDVYTALFPSRIDQSGERIEYNDHVKNIKWFANLWKLADVKYNTENMKNLESIIKASGNTFKIKNFFDGISSENLSYPYYRLDDNRKPFYTINLYYEWILLLHSRLNFLKGDFEKGLDWMERLVVFGIDKFKSSPSIEEKLQAISLLKDVTLELLPHAISVKFNGTDIRYCFCLGKLKRFQSLLLKMLKEMNAKHLLRRMYWDFIHDIKKKDRDVSALEYYLYGKLVLWRYFFSKNKMEHDSLANFKKLLRKRENDKELDFGNLENFISSKGPSQSFRTWLDSKDVIFSELPHTTTLAEFLALVIDLRVIGKPSEELKVLLQTSKLFENIGTIPFKVGDKMHDVRVVFNRNFGFLQREINCSNNYDKIIKSLKKFDEVKHWDQIRRRMLILRFSFFPWLFI
jgi:serine/threonine protein kinase